MSKTKKGHFVMLTAALGVIALTMLMVHANTVTAGQPRTETLNQIREVNGLKFQLGAVSRLGDTLQLGWCYQMPDLNNSDYLPKGMTFKADGVNLEGNLMLDKWHFVNGETMSKDEFVSTDSATKLRTNGQIDERCDSLTFQSPVLANAKTLEISVDGIALSGIREDITCDQLRAKLLERKAGYDVECLPSKDGNFAWRITNKPADMNEETAQRAIYNSFIDYRQGPWSFTVPLP